jgi:hypothetical protein
MTLKGAGDDNKEAQGNYKGARGYDKGVRGYMFGNGLWAIGCW